MSERKKKAEGDGVDVTSVKDFPFLMMIGKLACNSFELVGRYKANTRDYTWPIVNEASTLRLTLSTNDEFETHTDSDGVNCITIPGELCGNISMTGVRSVSKELDRLRAFTCAVNRDAFANLFLPYSSRYNEDERIPSLITLPPPPPAVDKPPVTEWMAPTQEQRDVAKSHGYTMRTGDMIKVVGRGDPGDPLCVYLIRTDGDDYDAKLIIVRQSLYCSRRVYPDHPYEVSVQSSSFPEWSSSLLFVRGSDRHRSNVLRVPVKKLDDIVHGVLKYRDAGDGRPVVEKANVNFLAKVIVH